MPMPAVPSTIMALFEQMTFESLDALCPADRERFMHRCSLWAKLASEPKGASKREPKSTAVVMQRAAEASRSLVKPTQGDSGIVGLLQRGERAEDSDERYVPRHDSREHRAQ